MKKVILTLCLLAATVFLSPLHAQTYRLEGAIGEYGITMVLNSKLEGYYYYDNRPKIRFKIRISTKRACRGEEAIGIHLHSCKHLVWQEYTPKGVNSGEFEGAFYIRGVNYAPGMPYDMEPTAAYFEGVFRNKSNGKVYEVYLEEEYDSDF